MIPASLRTLIDDTRGQRRAHWAGRELWLANEAWGELAVSLQGAQVLHFSPPPAAGALPAPTAAPDSQVPAAAPGSQAPAAAPGSQAPAAAPDSQAPAAAPDSQAPAAAPDSQAPAAAPDSQAPAAAPATDASSAQDAGSIPAFVPEGMAPGGWLWVTPTPQALPGAIRGGIPLCWPWFSDERTADESPDRSGPLHGPARKAQWRLDAVDEHDGGVELHLSPLERLHSQLLPRAVIQANARRLHVELITEHVGETPIKFSGALHSYLAVSDVHACRVEGLAGARYLDKFAGFAEGEQQGELGVRGPIDRIYHSNAELVLDDGSRRLRIARQGSDSAVVWHPGADLPADTPPDAGRHYLCVESANTRLDPVWLVPGAQHLLGTTLSLDARAGDAP